MVHDVPVRYGQGDGVGHTWRSKVAPTASMSMPSPPRWRIVSSALSTSTFTSTSTVRASHALVLVTIDRALRQCRDGVRSDEAVDVERSGYAAFFTDVDARSGR